MPHSMNDLESELSRTAPSARRSTHAALRARIIGSLEHCERGSSAAQPARFLARGRAWSAMALLMLLAVGAAVLVRHDPNPPSPPPPPLEVALGPAEADPSGDSRGSL